MACDRRGSERCRARFNAIADFHRQAARRPTCEIAHGGIEVRRTRVDERLLRRSQHGAHQRHAECLDAEFGVRLHLPPLAP